MNPVVPPRPDVSYVGVTTRPPNSVKSPPGSAYTTDREHARRREPPPIPPRDASMGEWEAREEMLSRELEEVKTRAAQMEKTMRWWSDCTANWREKWSKVRNERNKAREESRHLRSKLESAVKENSVLKRERHDATAEIESLRKQLESLTEKDKVSIASTGSHRSGSEPRSLSSDQDQVDQSHNPTENITENHVSQPGDQAFVDRLLAAKGEKDSDQSSNKHNDKHSDKYDKHSEKNDKHSDKHSDKERRKHKSDRHRESSKDDGGEEVDKQKISMLKKKLDEVQKSLIREREDKIHMSKKAEAAESEISSVKAKYEELKKSKEEAIEQLSRVREEHEDEVGRISSELEDETHTRSNMDRRLADLRKELERLQSENAQEWGKRERLESDKLSLERKKKKVPTATLR